MENNKTIQRSFLLDHVIQEGDPLKEKAMKTAAMVYAIGCYEQRDEEPAGTTAIIDIINWKVK